jgi:autotransporter-associated beta strand protein
MIQSEVGIDENTLKQLFMTDTFTNSIASEKASGKFLPISFSANRGKAFILAILALVTLSLGEVLGQTTFSWRNDQFPANNASWTSTAPFYFWNGSAGAVPGGGEILFFDGSQGTTMTNNLTSTNRHKITFGNTGSPVARTINGTTSNTFFEFGSTWPRIQNDATNITHTINFPIAASTNAGFNLELSSNAGPLVFGSTINTNSRTIQVYGNNAAIDGTNRFVRLGGVVSGLSGILNISQFGVAKLNAAHTYTGQTQIDNGELWIESAGSIAAGSGIFVGNGAQLTNVAKLWLSNATGATTFTNALTVNNGNTTTRYLGGLNTSGTHGLPNKKIWLSSYVDPQQHG